MLFRSWLALLAEGYGVAGQVDDGLGALAEAFALTEASGERGWEAELYRLKGELLAQQPACRLMEAEACLQQALDLARRQEAKALELRAALSLARLWQGQGRCDEARTLLVEIYDWFTEGFDTADLREARGLLESLGCR